MYMELVSIAVQLIIICLALASLINVSRGRKKKLVLESFIYYTNLNLVFCSAFYASSLLLQSGNWLLDRIYGFIFISAIITMSVYHFILVPAIRKENKGYRVYSRTDIAVHYVVPSLTVIHWLAFAKKGQFSFCHPLAWSAMFLAYFLAVLARARLGGRLAYNGLRYPYGFIDIDELGAKKVAINVICLAAAIIALGCLLVLLDNSFPRDAIIVLNASPSGLVFI